MKLLTKPSDGSITTETPISAEANRRTMQPNTSRAFGLVQMGSAHSTSRTRASRSLSQPQPPPRSRAMTSAPGGSTAVATAGGAGGAGGERKRDIAARYLKQGISQGEMALKRSIGLGQTPNVIPLDKPRTDCPPRTVLVGWHPVGGFAGKWFAENTGLGKMITEKINSYPDPTQHWAILVGDYVHQLWMDENFDVIYINGKVKIEEWHTFEVGTTHFNDDALRRTGEAIIESVRAKQAAYNLISNNCQTYALLLLDAIKASGDTKFPTTLTVYERLTGPGKVIDLFPEKQPGGDDEAVSMAQNVMNQNTTQLDTHAMDRDGDGIPDVPPGQTNSEVKEKKPGMFKRMFSKNKDKENIEN